MNLAQTLGVRHPGIFAAVGAGGKTSLLLSLCAELQANKHRFLLTATAKMYLHQVAEYEPVLENDYDEGTKRVKGCLEAKNYAAWFFEVMGEKVKGLPPQWLDRLFESGLVPYIFVEADGAREKLVKAPGQGEPIIPQLSSLTFGVLNLKAVGQQLSLGNTHRLDKVLQILGKEAGELITPRDLALLAGHAEGIFKDSRGENVLVISGGSRDQFDKWEEILAELKRLDHVQIRRCVLTEGFGKEMRPLAAYPLGL